MELNTDTPLLYCHLRSEFLYNGNSHHGELVPCVIFAASSIQGRAIGFHCMLNNGALIYRMPINAFLHKEKGISRELDVLELWDCLSSHITCNEYSFLRGLRVDVLLKDKTWQPGIYQFTLDWYGSSLADNPGEGGHKCAHVIALDEGCFCAQPNNRLRWHEPSFITEPFPDRPDYETNNRIFSAEVAGTKWHTDSSNRMVYSLVDPTTGLSDAIDGWRCESCNAYGPVYPNHGAVPLRCPCCNKAGENLKHTSPHRREEDQRNAHS